MSCRPIILHSIYVETYFSQENSSGNGPVLTFEVHHAPLSDDIATNVPNFEEECVMSQTVMKIKW